MSLENVMFYVYLIPAILLSLSFHELSHAYVSYRLGDPTAKNAGRLTLNPLKHLDLMGTIMIFVSTFSRGLLFGWAKPVPINPLYYRDRKKGTMLVSVAGPLSNILIAFAFSFPMAMLGSKYGANMNDLFIATNSYTLPGISLDAVIFNISRLFFVINISLAVFNVIPVPPLDGSKILSGVLPDRQYFKLMQYENYIGVAFLLIMFMRPQILSAILGPISWIFTTAIGFIVRPIIGLM